MNIGVKNVIRSGVRLRIKMEQTTTLEEEARRNKYCRKCRELGEHNTEEHNSYFNCT